MRSATTSMFTSSASGFLRAWIFKISKRSPRSGNSITTRRSKRPGRSKAGSSTSGRLVAAITITFSFGSKPSISTKIWLSVCSRSSLPPPTPVPRTRPTASISSTKIIAGAAFLAVKKRSRTRLAPTPTNISTNSEPEIEKNGTPASPATALASKVLPVPGAPISKMPLGMRAPMSKNFLGFLRKSTISKSSSFASLAPATSLKVTREATSLGSVSRGFDWPKENACIPAPFTWRDKYHTKNAISRSGARNGANAVSQNCQALCFLMSIETLLSASFETP